MLEREKEIDLNIYVRDTIQNRYKKKQFDSSRNSK